MIILLYRKGLESVAFKYGEDLTMGSGDEES